MLFLFFYPFCPLGSRRWGRGRATVSWGDCLCCSTSCWVRKAGGQCVRPDRQAITLSCLCEGLVLERVGVGRRERERERIRVGREKILFICFLSHFLCQGSSEDTPPATQNFIIPKKEIHTVPYMGKWKRSQVPVVSALWGRNWNGTLGLFQRLWFARLWAPDPSCSWSQSCWKPGREAGSWLSFLPGTALRRALVGRSLVVGPGEPWRVLCMVLLSATILDEHQCPKWQSVLLWFLIASNSKSGRGGDLLKPRPGRWPSLKLLGNWDLEPWGQTSFLCYLVFMVGRG